MTESASTPVPLVAQVLLDVSLPHLDRTFDYAVPEALDAAAVPGARVRVRFAGRKVNGFIVQRTNSTEHTGKLAILDTVVSREPVLTPAIADVARRVADHYAGTVADVLRLAIPPRHAKVEAEDVAPFVVSEPAKPEDLHQWQHLTDGEQFLGELSQGLPSRAVIAAPPSLSIAELVAQAIVRTRNGATHDHGKSVLVVVPDHRDVDHFVHVLETALRADCVTRLTADVGPAKRYRHWLSIVRGQSRVVVGTRAAMFAPVCEPGLFVIVDDGDDLHAEQHAPYPHVREVLAMRSIGESAGMLVIGRVQTCEGERLVRSGWARSITADREFVRSLSPRVHTVGSDAELERDPGAVSARLPSVALRKARVALESGPVLVQVPRAGYLPVVACQNCREVAHCDTCHGPLRLTGPGRAPMCGWCGTVRAQHVCGACGSSALRAVRTGAGRTAEELGRAFPGIQVITSGREGVVSRVSAKPALVVSTPGAEPIAEGGYSAALLLDGDSLLHRVDLRSDEEALRRWMNAASLVKPTGDVVIMADPAHASVQAVVRWDPLGFAHAEYQQRTVAHLPPTSRVAALDGPPRGIDQLMGELELPEVAEVLGPVPLDEPERVRLIIRVPLAQGAALAKELHRVQSVRSARKVADHVVVRIDPLNLI